MHTLVYTGPLDYRKNLSKLVTDAADIYGKICYISFNDPFHVVIKLLEETNTEQKYIVLDASGNYEERKSVTNTVFVVPINDLFNVYMFLRNIMITEKVDLMLIDSISALINKHGELPLREMMTDLLLEIGSHKCSSILVALREHFDHEVIRGLSPFIGKNFSL